ncbi:MAG: GNAT family protein [Flavobacterium sp.]|uniref:GNAT family N-acetyltransferase n=1 Tax=Flavobacterium sp. TaxID=239 RepID=UPI0032636DB6
MKLPPYKNFPTIAGDKITLREITASDIVDLIEISFYDGVQATTLEQAVAMNTKIINDYNDGNSIHWGIADNTTNKIVGTCGYYRGLDKGEGELGCILLAQFRGQGYMTSAMLLAIDFGLNTVLLKRIWAKTNQENKSAIKLLERLSFTKISEFDDDSVDYELKRSI